VRVLGRSPQVRSGREGKLSRSVFWRASPGRRSRHFDRLSMISGMSRVRMCGSSTATPRDTTSDFQSWQMTGTSGRERHRILLARCRARGEAVATVKRGGPRTVSGRHPLQPYESVYAARAAERAKGRADAACIPRHPRGPRHHNPRYSARDVKTKIGRMPSWCRRTLFW